MFITSPVRAALAPRQTNALSELVSEAIGLGNSVLGDLMTTDATALTTSTLPSSSTSSTTTPLFSSLSSTYSSTTPTPTTLAPSTSSTLAAASSTATPLATSTPTTLHTNKALVIALPIILCLLALALVFFAISAYRRRGKRQQSSSFSGADTKSSYASSDDPGLHHVTTAPNTAFLDPAPTLPILQTAYTRESPYEPMSPAPATTSPSNPFLCPTEVLRHDTTATANSTSTQHTSGVSHGSSDVEATLLSPISPTEMPAELNGDRGWWHSRPESRRRKVTALWPSRAESSKFDFGFGGDIVAHSEVQHQKGFQVPRRPVGRS